MKLPGFLLRALRRKRLPPHTVDDDYIALAFPSESELARITDVIPARLTAERKKAGIGRGTAAVLVLSALALAGVAMYSTASSVEQTGSLRVESEPSGASITIDGQKRGTTPLVVTIPAGHHAATVELGDRRRTLTLDVAPRETVVHHIELPTVAAPASASATGTLEVVGDSHARISIDGVPRGQAPMTVAELAPGVHEIAVSTSDRTYRRTVTVTAGASTSFVVAAAAATGGTASGWMTARTRLPLQILEQGHVVGTTEADRILLPVGDHEFEFVNESVGYRAARRVTISSGKTTDVVLALPQAPLQVNAIPWAEVWIDGTRIGETPLANVPETIGTHEVVFRHPQLGERRVTAVVTLTAPSRATVDMRVQ